MGSNYTQLMNKKLATMEKKVSDLEEELRKEKVKTHTLQRMHMLDNSKIRNLEATIKKLKSNDFLLDNCYFKILRSIADL